MTNNKIFLILGITIPIVILIGITVFAVFYLFYPVQRPAPLQTLDSNSIGTSVAQTIAAGITDQVVEPVSTGTNTQEPAATDTPSATIPPSATFTPTASPTAQIVIPTSTAVPPTPTPTATSTPAICNQAQFVRDLSAQDGSLLSPGTSFVKTWRLKNIGHCTWTKNYALVFQSGNAMDAKHSISLPGSVEPNQTIDLSVAMNAPKQAGSYRGDWILSDPSGRRFGIGTRADQSFWVQIRVKQLVNPNLDYDFAANYCRAEWRSAVGRLPCPGTSSGSEGFVILLDNPRLENRNEDELALWTHPNFDSRGWIAGTFPEFTIQPDQHFKAWVGCLSESKGCNVDLRLDFYNLKNGITRNLGSWHEVYDGEVTNIDLDLSPHAGKRVRFILTVEISGGEAAQANAFWFVPGIVHIASPTPTPVPPTPTQSPTMTPTPTGEPTQTPTPTETSEEP